MKPIFLYLFFISSITIFAQGEPKYIETNHTFSPNETVYLFGNDVKLRAAPNSNSDVKTLLKIAEKVTIIEKTDQTLTYNGIDWPWYKVSYKNQTGYIIGGLLALDMAQIHDSIYLVSLYKEDDKYVVLTRLANKDTSYIEHKKRLGSASTFQLKVYNNRGIDGITDMVFIDFIAEACGIDGGGYYLFNQNNALLDAIELQQISDSGMYWYIEEVIFPDEKGGTKGKIILNREQGETIDDDSDWVKTKHESREFIWTGVPLELK